MDYRGRAEADNMYQSVIQLLNAGQWTESSNLLYRLIYSFPNYAPAYWLRMIIKYGATPENVADQQIDFTGNPDFVMAMNLATPEEKAEYEYIYNTCLGNIALQQECDQRKLEVSKAYQTMSTDDFLFEQKENLENELNRFPKKIKLMKSRPVTYVGMGIYGLSHLVVIIGLFFLLFTSSHHAYSGTTELIYGIYSVTLIFGYLLAIPLAIVGMFLLFAYKALPSIPYAISISVLCAVVMVVFVLGSDETVMQVGGIVCFVMIYLICFTVIPLIFFVKTYPFSKRMGGDIKQLKQRYEILLAQYREVIDALHQNFANLLNQIQYECMLRRSSPTAVLYDNVPPYYQTFINNNTATYKKYEKYGNSIQKKKRKKKENWDGEEY